MGTGGCCGNDPHPLTPTFSVRLPTHIPYECPSIYPVMHVHLLVFTIFVLMWPSHGPLVIPIIFHSSVQLFTFHRCPYETMNQHYRIRLRDSEPEENICLKEQLKKKKNQVTKSHHCSNRVVFSEHHYPQALDICRLNLMTQQMSEMWCLPLHSRTED